jgi:hypothetical protein
MPEMHTWICLQEICSTSLQKCRVRLQGLSAKPACRTECLRGVWVPTVFCCRTMLQQDIVSWQPALYVPQLLHVPAPSRCYDSCMQQRSCTA